MSEAKHKQSGTLRRRAVSLFTALTFLVLSITGVLGFILPFDIGIIGLHSLMGFLFVVLIGLHILNNNRQLKGYLRSKTLWVTLAVTAFLTALFWWQPAPVKVVLGWSGNLGPTMERFEMDEEGMVFDYTPSPDYKMRLTVKPGPTYKTSPPPHVAIWLENQGGYHIKSLLVPEDFSGTPYYAFKHAGWEKAKREADESVEQIDAVSSPTPNGSFDPADYILPGDTGDSTPYALLLEINQPGDDQASLVYSVEIDNSLPRHFQLLDLRGFPKREDIENKETWGLYYVDSSFTTALELIDSVLLTIGRSE